MTLDQLRKKWIEAYSEDDAKYSEKANAAINEHFDRMPPSSSKTDPDRLGTRANFISRLRQAIIAKVGSIEVPGRKEFNALSLKEQLRFQAVSFRNEANKWVWNEQILPENLKHLGMNMKDKQALFDHRAKVN